MICMNKNWIHDYRIFNIAVFDLLCILIGGILIHYNIGYKYISLMNIYILLFILGIIMHKLFNVNTTINKLIFNPFLLLYNIYRSIKIL